MDFSSRPQTIFRNASPRRSYTQICNEMLQNYELSLDATGFLVRILSLPPQWDFCKAWAQDKFGIGEQKLERILKETARLGYSRFTRGRLEDGTLGRVVYSFTDVPGVFEDDDHTVKTAPVDTTNHTVKNHDVGQPPRGKSRTIKNSDLEKKNTIKNNNLSAEQDSEFRCKKYASELSRTATVEEDVQRFAIAMKKLDVNACLAPVVFNPPAYAELGAMMDNFGAPAVEEAIREIILRQKTDGKVRRGGIRSWHYFAKESALVAAKMAATKSGVEIEECPF